MSDLLNPAEFPASSSLRASLGDEKLTTLLRYMELIECGTGTPVIDEGDHERSTFVICSGGVRVVRDGLDLGHLGQGESFGELALLPRRRDASIICNSPTRLARLSADAWQRLCQEEPEVGLETLRTLVAKAHERPSEFSDGAMVLPENATPRREEVDIHIGDAPQRILAGTPAHVLLPERVDDQLVVAALLDRKAVSLTTPINAPCTLSSLTTATLDGQRFFRHSQALLLLEAAHQVDPSLRPRLSHSLGFAQRVELQPSNSHTLDELAAAIDEKMREIVEANVALIEEWVSVNEAREMFESRGWTDAAQQLTLWRSALIKMVSYGQLLVTSPGPLVPMTGLIGRARLIADNDVLLLVYGREGGRPIAGTPDPGSISQMDGHTEATGRFAAMTAFRQTRPSVHQQKRWLSAVGIGSVGEFNQACIDGNVSQIIHVSEGFQEKRISIIADEIAARADKLKIVAVSGPSSSGKTTFIRRLKVQLQVNGLTPVGLSLDDYYCDRAKTPLDAHGEYDYESLGALQVELLEEHLGRLTSGEEVQTPRYDFVRGESLLNGGPRIRLGGSDVLLL
jgi:uridine kinase